MQNSGRSIVFPPTCGHYINYDISHEVPGYVLIFINAHVIAIVAM